MTKAPSHQTMPIPPDGFVLLSLFITVLLEWLAPVSILPAPALLGPLTPIALVLALAGLALEIAAARALNRGGTSTRPNDAPEALVTTGIFRWSRNPFYCGILLLVAGAMVGFSLEWGVVLLPLLWLSLDRLVIPVEERRLEHAFGQSYLDYAATTRRWL